MPAATKNVAVFGSTGSIGANALEVIAASNGRLRVAALSAHCKLPQLLDQAQKFQPRWVVATDEKLAHQFDWTSLPSHFAGAPGEVVSPSARSVPSGA